MHRNSRRQSNTHYLTYRYVLAKQYNTTNHHKKNCRVFSVEYFLNSIKSIRDQITISKEKERNTLANK